MVQCDTSLLLGSSGVFLKKANYYPRHFKYISGMYWYSPPLVFTVLNFSLQLDTIQLEVYWFSSGLLILVVALFILVIILFVKLTSLKNEMRRKVKEVHKFNVPYIDPKEDLAKRGFAQYPHRSIALQH